MKYKDIYIGNRMSNNYKNWTDFITRQDQKNSEKVKELQG